MRRVTESRTEHDLGVDLGHEESRVERDYIVDRDLFRSPHVVELGELDVSASADDGDRRSATRARAIDLRDPSSRGDRSDGLDDYSIIDDFVGDDLENCLLDLRAKMVPLISS